MDSKPRGLSPSAEPFVPPMVPGAPPLGAASAIGPGPPLPGPQQYMHMYMHMYMCM